MKFEVSVKFKNGAIKSLHNVMIISREIGFGGTPIIEFIREDWTWQNIRASEVDNLLCEVQDDEKGGGLWI